MSTTRLPLHPLCRVCGWAQGGQDSWDGVACKCRITAPPFEPWMLGDDGAVDGARCDFKLKDNKFSTEEKKLIPPTKNGLSSMACLSALQKCIRRGMEREAMQFAIELMHTSKAFHSMVTKRLEVICHEDVDTGSQPHIVPFVHAAMAQAREWYEPNPEKLGKSRMAVGNSIRMMCRAKKNREGDHFAAACGWAEILERFVPEIPEWAHDKHTAQGKRLGRGLDYFRTESTRCIPPIEKDAYEDEAYRLWTLKDNR